MQKKREPRFYSRLSLNYLKLPKTNYLVLALPALLDPDSLESEAGAGAGADGAFRLLTIAQVAPVSTANAGALTAMIKEPKAKILVNTFIISSFTFSIILS